MANQKYRLEISFNQVTDGETDNETLMTEFSNDPIIHSLKTQIMTKHLTQMLYNMTKEFTDLAMSMGGETLIDPEQKPGKK